MSTQGSFFFGSGKSPTSRRAWWNVQRKMPARIALAYRFTMQSGQYGATGDELEWHTGIIHQSMGSVLLELRRAGLLVNAHRTRMTRNGEQAEVYVGVPFGQHIPNPYAGKNKWELAARDAYSLLCSGRTQQATEHLAAAIQDAS